MKKIKICYVIVNCKISGPMNQTLNIIKNLDYDKYDISFITLFEEEKNNSMINEYLNVCSQHYCLKLNKFSSILFGKYVLKERLKTINPDIIHALGMPPYRLALSYKNAKHLVTLRNYMYEDYPTYYNKILGPILAFMDMNLIKRKNKQGKKFVTCSKSLSKIYLDKENLKFDYIQNGVDISKYEKGKEEEKEELRNKLNLPKDGLIAIYTAPFIGRKDQETAIKGILSCKDENMYLVLCGDGAMYRELYDKYNKYHNIIFTGKVKNVSEYLRSADFYLSTSQSEGMPNSVLEAMASGIGVLLSNIPQHMELFDINNNIGEYFELGNEDDLKSKIKLMMKKDFKYIGDESYKMIINNLTSKIMSEKYQIFYEKLAIGGNNEGNNQKY